MSRRYSTLVVAALALVALTCVAFLIPVPYVTLKPGPVFNTLGSFDDKAMITFDGDVKTYPTGGTLDFTTVSVSRADTEVSLSTAMQVFFDKKNAVVPRDLVYPDGQNQKESAAESAVQLTNSKDSSTAAGLRAAGYAVDQVPVVASVAKDGPARGELVAGDVVLAVDGQKVADAAEVSKLIKQHKPGESAAVKIRRDGDPKTVTITTAAVPGRKSVARVGIGIKQDFTFPIEVTNNVGHEIGGPSAGAMFALAIYDKLTPGRLTGGQRVAGTGEIDSAGTVGPIGGIRQKMAGAAADKTDIFLVPSQNCSEAASGDDFGMTLVRVENLKDAISSLERLAKDPESKVPTCS